MPDLTNFSFTVLGNVQVTVPRVALSALVVDSENQANVIADFTGANRIIFPDFIAGLTVPQRHELIRRMLFAAFRHQAGLEDLGV